MQPIGTPASLTSSGTSSTSNSQAVQTPGQSNSALPQGEPAAGTQPSLLSGEQSNESIDGNTPLSAVINLLGKEIRQIEVVEVAAQTLSLELPPSYTQILRTFEDIAQVAELSEVARQHLPVNTVQHLLPPFYQASTETGLESGDSATREDSVEADDGASTELDTSHGESTTEVATPAGSTAAGPRNDAAQAFIAAAASAGIKLGPIPEPNAHPKASANAPKSQQPIAGPSTYINPASSAFATAQRLHPRSQELVPSGAPSSDHPVSGLAGHGLNPAAAAFQPAAQQLDPTTAALVAGYQAAVQGGAYPGRSEQASGEQNGAETGANTPGPWLSPRFPPNPQGISFDGDERGNGAATVAEPAPKSGLYGSGDELPPDPPLVDFVYPGEVPPGWQIAVTVISDEWAEYVMWEDPDWEPENGEGGECSSSPNGLGSAASQGANGTASSCSDGPGHPAKGQLYSEPSSPDGPRPSGANGGEESQPGHSRRRPSFPLEGRLKVASRPLQAIPESLFKTGDEPYRESCRCNNCGHPMSCIPPGGSRCTRCKRGRYCSGRR